MIPFIIIGIFALFLLTGLFVVKQQTAAIVERFGKFLKSVSLDYILKSL